MGCKIKCRLHECELICGRFPAAVAPVKQESYQDEGRSLEGFGNGSPRLMIVIEGECWPSPLKQNPAYRLYSLAFKYVHRNFVDLKYRVTKIQIKQVKALA